MSETDVEAGSVSQDGIGYCIRPGSDVPPTVLVAEMSDGALLLQGWRVGPSAYVCRADTGPLREALAAAFGSDLASAGSPTAVHRPLS
ncbi:MAG: hypothetical protein ACT4NY_17090 [Pseudonocardiales bacterium]